MPKAQLARFASDVQAASMREVSRQAYDILQSYLRQLPHLWPLKPWNYIPAINEDAGDQARYRQFCRGARTPC